MYSMNLVSWIFQPTISYWPSASMRGAAMIGDFVYGASTEPIVPIELSCCCYKTAESLAPVVTSSASWMLSFCLVTAGAILFSASTTVMESLTLGTFVDPMSPVAC